MIKLITAIGKDGLIGKGDKLAWHIPEELKFFKDTTNGDSMLFGLSTFEGLPTLKGRKIYVLGLEQPKKDWYDVYLSSLEQLNEVFDKYRDSDETLWIAGGKSIYEQFGHHASEWYITHVKGDYDGDVFMNLDYSDRSKEVILEDELFTVCNYKK